MIYVDRKNIPEPEFWDSPQFQDLLKEWSRFHGVEGGTRGTQRRMPYGKELDHFRLQALWPLLEAFHGKCAYTEQKISEKDAVVVFHRPEADAMGDDPESSPQHYWWGVRDWTNWYPASREVQIAKGTVFPVAGERSPLPDSAGVPSSRWLDRNRDRGLLLDPARDHPAWFLDFRVDGTVRPRSHPSPRAQSWADDHSRGEITIKVLDLNHRRLVVNRKGALSRSLPRWTDQRQALGMGAAHPAKGQIGMFWRDNQVEYAGALRQYLAQDLLLLAEVANSREWFSSSTMQVIESLSEELAAEIAHNGVTWSWPSEPPGGVSLWEPVRRVIQREWPELAGEDLDRMILGQTQSDLPLSLSVEPTAGGAPSAPEPAMALGVTRGAPEPESSHLESERIIERSARVKSLKIRNFKAIEELALEVSTEGEEILPRYGTQDETLSAVNWTVFLGENGSGKSCCLQAIGLALAGDRLDDLIASAGLEWRKLLRRGENQGRVFLEFTGGATVDLRFNAKKHWWVGGAPRMAGFVRGYGATRLLEGDSSPDGSDANVRLANLVDPRAPVLDAERWLLHLEDQGDFHAAALTLGGFLGAEAPILDAFDENASTEPFLTRDEEQGEVLAAGDPLSYASDGYRAVVALVCDIMAGLGVGLSDMRNATGIVLIDEIGAHLHPRWKMEITSRLRREFPRLQFFVSTHEPLCLRGLREREVVRVRKERPSETEKTSFAGRVRLEVIERSPSDYRVDQLLTSEFFGLDTTIDPDLDRRFQAYYRLLAMTEEERSAKKLAGHPSRSLEEEYQFLRAQLRSLTRPVLGFTRRDQLVYEAIDQFLVAESNDSPESRRRRRGQVLEKIKDIWRPPDFLKRMDRDTR